MLRVLLISLLAVSANAADPSFFKVEGDKLIPVQKVSAMKLLITTDNKTEIVKCVPVKVDEDKGTLRNK